MKFVLYYRTLLVRDSAQIPSASLAAQMLGIGVMPFSRRDGVTARRAFGVQGCTDCFEERASDGGAFTAV